MDLFCFPRNKCKVLLFAIACLQEGSFDPPLVAVCALEAHSLRVQNCFYPPPPSQLWLHDVPVLKRKKKLEFSAIILVLTMAWKKKKKKNRYAWTIWQTGCQPQPSNSTSSDIANWLSPYLPPNSQQLGYPLKPMSRAVKMSVLLYRSPLPPTLFTAFQKYSTVQYNFQQVVRKRYLLYAFF